MVHATAGASALTLAWMLGRRNGFPRNLKPPHSPGMVMTGAAMLWVGWFGFNAGSAGAADTSAGMAMLVTHLSAATAAWFGCLSSGRRQASQVLSASLPVRLLDLLQLPPLLEALVLWSNYHWSQCGHCYACGFIKEKLGVDDSLDVAAVHGIGGILGTLLVSYWGRGNLRRVGNQQNRK